MHGELFISTQYSYDEYRKKHRNIWFLNAIRKENCIYTAALKMVYAAILAGGIGKRVENNNITVTLPEKAHGTITIYVNDDFYDVEINTTTNKATVTLPYLKEGNYTVYVSYADEWYAFKDNSSDFKVIKLKAHFKII